MVELKNDLKVFLKQSNKKYSFADLRKLFSIDSKKGLNILEKTLTVLESEGFIYKDSKGYISSLEGQKYLQGKIKIAKDGIGYVKTKNNNTITISIENLTNIFNGDIVIVKNDSQKKKTLIGQIDKVIKRENKEIPAIVCIKNGVPKVYSMDNNKNEITLPKEEYSDLIDGQIILVDVSDTENFNYHKKRCIGYKNDHDYDIKLVACKHSFRTDFSPKTLEEVKNFSKYIDLEKDLKNRVDLRDKNFFTIDDAKCMDLDDAIGIEVLENGNYKLYVSIADVSHYVPLNSSIFKDAFFNTTSLYAPDFVIPMLPPELSNGICSLGEKQGRLTKTWEMTYTKEGKLISAEIYKSVISSQKKMTYTNINAILEDNKDIPSYENFIKDLQTLRNLNDFLEEKKKKRGYVSLNTDEIEVIREDEGIKIESRCQGIAEKIIENCMLEANEQAAIFISKLEIPLLFRIHDKPNEEKLSNIINLINKLGYGIPLEKNLTSNFAVQKMANRISNFDKPYIFCDFLLSGMKKAIYSTENNEHFGLALKKYTHFTAPIRRFIDLVIHIIIDKILDGTIYNIDLDKLEKMLKLVANHCSEREKAADKFTKEVNMMLMAEHMENNIGQVVDAVIIRIDKNSLAIKTEDNFYGKILFKDLGSSYHNKDNCYLINNENGHTLKIGDTINCTLIAASKEARTINFKINQKSKGQQKIKR